MYLLLTKMSQLFKGKPNEKVTTYIYGLNLSLYITHFLQLKLILQQTQHFDLPQTKFPKKGKIVTPKIPLLVALSWLVLTVTATSRTQQIKRADEAGDTAKHEGGTMNV